GPSPGYCRRMRIPGRESFRGWRRRRLLPRRSLGRGPRAGSAAPAESAGRRENHPRLPSPAFEIRQFRDIVSVNNAAPSRVQGITKYNRSLEMKTNREANPGNRPQRNPFVAVLAAVAATILVVGCATPEQ